MADRVFTKADLETEVAYFVEKFNNGIATGQAATGLHFDETTAVMTIRGSYSYSDNGITRTESRAPGEGTLTRTTIEDGYIVQEDRNSTRNENPYQITSSRETDPNTTTETTRDDANTTTTRVSESGANGRDEKRSYELHEYENGQ